MGALDRFRRKPEPLTAAAVTVLAPEQLRQSSLQSRESGEAWRAYRCLGEVRYVTNQQARLIGRLDWTVTLDGGDPMETDKSDELLRAAFGDNLEDLATRAALQIQVPGGYVLARTRSNDADSWRVYSSPLSAKNKKRVERADVVVQVRIEDPEDEDLNDSPVLGAMDTCRALILARAEERAQSRSRTAQHGLLLYPTDGLAAGQTPAAFEAELQDTITAPLADERTTASVTPNIIGFPSEMIEKWKILDISGNYDEKLDAKIDRLVRSLAVQLDVPPELLMGFGDSNHWSAWAIQEDNWLGHVEPMAKPIGKGFARAIMQATGSTGLKITPDPGPLLQRRPTPADALAAHAAGVVSDEWTREQIGADETDAPPPGQVVVEQVTPPPPAVAEPAAIAASLQGRLPVVAAAQPVDARALAAIDTQAYDAVEDLVTDTADRALERLGAKVRSLGADGGIELPKDVPNSELAVRFEGQIPNAEVAISQTIESSLPKLDRIVNRAFARLRSEGVDLTLDPDDAETARSLYGVLVADAIRLRLEGKPALAETWQASRRVVAVAGGNGDPAPAVDAA